MDTYGHQTDFLFVSNDRLQEAAVEMNIPSISIHQYAKKFTKQYPELLEVLAHTENLMDQRNDGDGPQDFSSVLYPPYKSMPEIEKD